MAMVGTTLWSYRIESKIGAGGMGVVYKAVDTRLERTLAVKVLPASALANPDRQKRFVQEAKAASSLNHPNIVTIYDINTHEVDGQPVQYIAMEYVAGETLDKLIGRKGLRVREALKYAIQVADALSAAHAAGIVHRDLKPSNIMITPQGLVKVLDFGLAKLAGPLEPDAYAETLHAEASPHTEEGTILGTVAYMSPEQADGQKIDARSDIFSFGSVLYEMVTGRQAFPGSSKLSMLSAVMYKDPQPVSQAVPDIHPELERIISRCLKKEPQRRWQTMADVKVALEELRDELEMSGIVSAQPRPAKPVTGREWRWIAIAAFAVIVLVLVPAAYFAPQFLRPAPPSFQRLTFRRGDVTSAKFAPGGAIVYSAEWDGAPSSFYSVIPGNREGRPLQLPPGRVMSISGSGEMAILLGSGPAGTLARVPFGGGAPRGVLENVYAADWGPDGESLAVVRKVGSKYRLEYPIGNTLYQTEARPQAYARVSRDGKLVAFFDYDPEVGDYSVSIVGPDHPRQVLSRGWRGVGWLNWSPSGKEIWFSGAQAGADPAVYAIDLSGQQRLVSQAPGFVIMQDVARDGRVLINAVNSRLGILYVPADGSAQRDLAWFDASRVYDLAQDGNSLVFIELGSGEGRNAAIYLRKIDGSPAVHLGYGNRPALSPDGKWVVSIHHQPARSELLLLPTGPGEVRTLDFGDMHYESVEWFPDGKRLLFTGNEPGNPVRSWVYDLDSHSKPTPVTSEGVRATRVSPDGHSFVVVDSRKVSLAQIGGGQPEVIIELQPGESIVRWSGDGRFLFLAQFEGETVKLTRLEVSSRKRQPWRVLKVPENGAEFFGPVVLSADGKAVACTFQHDLANLYLVKGLK
jgi:Tol biopolymer transport system component/tRNA A-37 threonylcarbamoyl transferase component Bud32